MSDRDILQQWPVLILPGWLDSEPDHWQSLWQSRFGWKRVQQNDWNEPKKADWVKNIAREIKKQKKAPVVITHSLGGIALAQAVKQNPSLPVRGAFIVAPADLDRPDMPKEIVDFRPVPLENLPFPSIVAASHNDPFVDIKRAKQFAKHWGSELIDVGPQGHINVLAGMGEWPEGLEILTDFLKGLEQRAADE